MNKWKKYDLWRMARDYCNKKMTEVWFEGGNCDSCCPNCKQYESLGNGIQTIDNDDGSETRICRNCGFTWRTVFTPAGFIRIDGEKELDTTEQDIMQNALRNSVKMVEK